MMKKYLIEIGYDDYDHMIFEESNMTLNDVVQMLKDNDFKEVITEINDEDNYPCQIRFRAYEVTGYSLSDFMKILKIIEASFDYDNTKAVGYYVIDIE